MPNSLMNYLRTVAGAWREDPRDDAELLARFVDGGDEAAFRVLVWRHGQLVWRACVHVLGSGPDAEDTFQTVFLALARNAGRLRREPLAGWLHRVARRAALNADAGVRRRRNLEHQLRTVPQPEQKDNPGRTELYAALDEELASLPERLRIPLVLRHLEGKTLEDVARIVGCSRRDLGRRLTRGEAILRERLERRGLAVGVVSVAVLLGGTTGAPAVPAHLIGSTARAAAAFHSGTLTSGTAAVMRAVVRSLPIEGAMMRKIGWMALACVGLLGAGLAAWLVPAGPSDGVEAAAPESPKMAAGPGNGQVDRDGDPLPPGALARLGTLHLRHAGSFGMGGGESVVFSRDGKVLITAGPANPIQLWDAATGKLLRSFGDRRTYRGVPIALSPDGNTLAVGTREDGDIFLWEIATGKRLRQLPKESILALVFSQDGRTLLSADRDNRICVWEVAMGKQVHDRPLLNVEKADRPSISIFSPDCKTLASIHKTSDNNIVYLWEAASGKELRHLPLGKGEFPRGAIAFSPDSRFLAVGSFSEDVDNRSDGAVHLWEVATGKEVGKLTPDKAGTYSVAFSPDSKILATGSGFGPIRLWEAATGKEVRKCQGYRACVAALAFSPDGSTLASLAGLHDHTARLWEVASGKELVGASRGHVGPVVSVAFSADGKSLISGGRDGLVGFWNAETGREQRPPLRVGDFQALAALPPDGKTFLTVSNIFSPNVLPNSNPYEVALKASSLVCVWDRATGQKLREFKGPVGAPQSLTLSSDGKVLLWNSWNRVYLIEVATGKEMRSFHDASPKPKCAVLSPDGKTLAVCLYDMAGKDVAGTGKVHFYETATGKDLGSIKAQGDIVWCLAFSPDGQALAIGGVEDTQKTDSDRHTIRLWRVRANNKGWKEVGTLVGHQDVVWGLAFSPDDKTLASTSRDGTVRLWEVATGKERRRLAGHGGEAWCLAFAPGGRRLAAGCNDTTILVWDVTGRLHSGQLRPVQLTDKELKGLWADLAGADAVRAGQAVWTLAAAPAQALPLLREHLRPVAPPGPRIVRLIADLDSDAFAVRQKATDELEKLGKVAEPALRQALAKSASLEMHRRLEQLLERLEEKFSLSGEKLRSQRALEVLGQMGPPEALTLLEKLAQGAPGAPLTREAQAVLKCLHTRVNAIKP